MLGQLPGRDPAKAAAAKLQREIAAKNAARRYEAYCDNCGMDAFNARRLAPPLVRRGQALRSIEAKERRRDALKARKEAMERRFGGGS